MSTQMNVCYKKLLLSNLSMKKVSCCASVDSLRFKSSKHAATLKHCDSKESYGNEKLPENVEEIKASQKMKYTQVRARDVSSAHIGIKMSQPGSVFCRGLGSQSSQMMGNQSNQIMGHQPYDNHVGKYDCNHTVSLSSVIDGNVPHPYNKMGTPTSYHLGQPTGLKSQTDKYTAGDLQSYHYAQQNNKKPAK